MAFVNLSEAARLAGCTRPTIYKHIKKGELSAKRAEDGKGWLIDSAELLRVYQNIQYTVNDETPVCIEDLQREIDILHVKLEASHDQIETRDLMIAQQTAHISDLQRLIGHKPTGKGFWAGLFGKN